MRSLLLFLILISPSFSKIILESNYPLRNSNIYEYLDEENLPLILWTLQNIKDVKDINISLRGKDIAIYVERYHIVGKIIIKGNWFVSDPEIKNLLGIREGEPLIEFDPNTAVENLKRFYGEKGFLDAEIKITVTQREGGFVDVTVSVKEGNLYFLGYPRFDGLRSVSFRRILTESDLHPGEVFSRTKAKAAQEKVSAFLRKSGFYENIVYFEGIEKRDIKESFQEVLYPRGRKGLKGGLYSLMEGFSNLLNHPLATLKALIGKGRIAVPVFTVMEGKRYRVVFEGNSFFPESDLRKTIFERTSGIDYFFLEASRSKLEELYKSKGFFEVKVIYTYQEGEILFIIKEGPRYKILPKGYVPIKLPQYYDKNEIMKLVEEKKENLKEKGYLSAKISIKENIVSSDKTVYIEAKVDKGKKVILKDLLYYGQEEELREIFEKVRNDLPTVLNDEILENLNREINRYFLTNGYLEGTFSVDIKVEETQDTIMLEYRYKIKKGPRYRYGKFLTYGNEVTRSREIDYITVKEDYYSSLAEEETMWNLVQSEIFTGVKIESFIDRDKKLVHRLIEVREDKRGSIEGSFGYNTEEKFKVEAGLKLKNLWGLGIMTRIYASYSERYRTYEATLSDNFFFTWKHFVDMALFRRFEFHESFDLDTAGFSATIGYRPWRWHTVSAIYSATDNRVIGTEPGRYRIRRYGVFFVREKRDDVLNPKNMSHISLRFIKAEGDTSYTKTELNSFFLKELLSWFSINTRLSAGSVDEGAPIFERFFLGGLRNMRGYNFESIGYPRGGRVFYFGRLEMMFRFYEPLWGTIYGEVGNVGKNFQEAWRSPKFDAGIALGISSPAGFIRLDIARALTPINVSVPPFRVYLSIGYIY